MFTCTEQEHGLRKVQIFRNNTWVINELFINIKVGDKFRLYENDDSIVEHEDGTNEFIAKSLPYFDCCGFLTIDIDK